MTGLLEGKVAVVTGGLSGIGLATVRRFVDEGASVVVGDLQEDRDGLILGGLGGKAVAVRTDVTNEADLEALVSAAVERFGRLDVMVNNAGAQGDPSPILESTAAGFDATMALLTRSVVLGHRFAAAQFVRQGGGGSIISTASAAGLQGGWSAVGYTTAKHAVIGVMRQAVAELAPLGIRSNAIAPGVVLTPIMAKSFGVPVEQSAAFEAFLGEQIGHTQPLQRLASPDDIADVAVFLASDLSRYVVGAVIPVDGGATAVTQGSFGVDVVAAANDFVNGR